MNMEKCKERVGEKVQSTDFMTPEQRKEAIAQILATVGLRILKAEDEQDQIQ